MKRNPPLPQPAALNALIKESHLFHGQEIYAELGPSIARKKPIFRVIFTLVRIASKSRILNMIMVASVVLFYRVIREPTDNVEIFQYGVSRNNVAAFERLNSCLTLEIRGRICVNGRRIPIRGRLKVALSLIYLWKAAGVLVRERHANPLVHLQSVLASAAALVFAKRPLSDRLRAVCVASDHSPICMALLAAARMQGKATCYAQHAPVTRFFPPLTYDLSILFDRNSVEAYRKAAERRHTSFGKEKIILLAPYSNSFHAPQTGSSPYRIGICLSFIPNVRTLEELIISLSSRTDVSKILLRRHPRCRYDWGALAALSNVDLRPHDEAAKDFFSSVDIALVPNSGVAIEGLHYGCPTYFAGGTDMLPDDYYGFVSSGILPIFSFESLKAPASFFDAAWQDRFSLYDETISTPLRELQVEAGNAFMAMLHRAS